MLPVVKMPDVEAAIVDFLIEALADRPEAYCSGVVVSTRNPNPIPSRYARVRRVGGVVTDRVLDRPRLDVLVWARNDAERMDLSQMIHALLIANGATSALAPIQVPDPTDRDRTVTLQTVEVLTRGSEA